MCDALEGVYSSSLVFLMPWVGLISAHFFFLCLNSSLFEFFSGRESSIGQIVPIEVQQTGLVSSVFPRQQEIVEAAAVVYRSTRQRAANLSESPSPLYLHVHTYVHKK